VVHGFPQLEDAEDFLKVVAEKVPLTPEKRNMFDSFKYYFKRTVPSVLSVSAI